MAKRKTKTNTKATSGLVGTQRAAIDALKTKGDLAKLAAKLVVRHGTPEQRALKAREMEALKRGEIEALMADLAVRAHERKQRRGHVVRQPARGRERVGQGSGELPDRWLPGVALPGRGGSLADAQGSRVGSAAPASPPS